MQITPYVKTNQSQIKTTIHKPISLHPSDQLRISEIFNVRRTRNRPTTDKITSQPQFGNRRFERRPLVLYQDLAIDVSSEDPWYG